MKKIVFMALIAIFTLGFTLEAQNNGRNRDDNRQGPGQGMRWTAKDRADTMAKELKLTDAEKTKVLALLEKQDAKFTEQLAQQRANGNNSQDREARRAEMQTLRDKTQAENDTALEAIIGKQKTEQWKKIRTERENQMRNSNRAGRQAPR